MFTTKKSKPLPEINTTSLPDIIFMLLFYFMVVTVLRKDNTTPIVTLPSVSYAELMKNEDIVALALTQQNNIYTYQLGSDSYQKLHSLEAALTEKHLNEGEKSVKILADKMIPMKTINGVKTALQRAKYFSIEYLVSSDSK